MTTYMVLHIHICKKNDVANATPATPLTSSLCLNMSISMKRGVNHFLRLLDSSRTFRDGGPYLKYLNREDAAHLMSLTFS